MAHVGLGFSFEDMRTRNLFYADKTGFIREWWEAKEKVTFITRPRQFGKTAILNMVNCFFSMKYANRHDLFDGLEIWKDEKYHQLQGTLPVIRLSFLGIKEQDFSSAVHALGWRIKEGFNKFKDILENSYLDKKDKEKYVYYLKKDICAEDISESLIFLSYCIKTCIGKKTIILIDECDVPLQSAWMDDYWEQMGPFMHSFFRNTFINNPYLEKGLLIGVHSIVNEAMEYDCRNSVEISTPITGRYETYFGLTEAEVSTAMKEYGYTDTQKVQNKYGNFTFGSQKNMYNTWSVANYLCDGDFSYYWMNSSENRIIRKFIEDFGDQDLEMYFFELLHGKTLEIHLQDNIVFNRNKNAYMIIWSLLVGTGYVKAILNKDTLGTEYKNGQEVKRILESTTYTVSITNEETKRMLERFVEWWFKRNKKEEYDFAHTLLTGNIKQMNVLLNTSVQDGILRGMGIKQKEDMFHVFISTMLEFYLDKRLFPRIYDHDGYFSVIFEPRVFKERRSRWDNSPYDDHGYVLVFKMFDKETEKDIFETLDNTFKRITECRYGKILENSNISKENIHKYGIAYDGEQFILDTENGIGREASKKIIEKKKAIAVQKKRFTLI